MARATSSLPLPLSPSIRTGYGASAARRMASRTRSAAGPRPEQVVGIPPGRHRPRAARGTRSALSIGAAAAAAVRRRSRTRAIGGRAPGTQRDGDRAEDASRRRRSARPPPASGRRVTDAPPPSSTLLRQALPPPATAGRPRPPARASAAERITTEHASRRRSKSAAIDLRAPLRRPGLSWMASQQRVEP